MIDVIEEYNQPMIDVIFLILDNWSNDAIIY